MKASQRHASPPAEVKTTGWLTTFNDLVTLLMVFFVLLFSMSTIDTKRMKSFQYMLQSGLGVLEEGNFVSVGVTDERFIGDMAHVMTQPEGTSEDGNESAAEQVIREASEILTPDLGIRTQHTTQGASFTFEDTLLFDFGQADINPQAFPLLDKISSLLNRFGYPLRVEGHTDNVPIHTKAFPSNWELSTARAVNVVKYLVVHGRIDPRRLSAVGYGESKPFLPNTSSQNRARNRRVEIVLLTEATGKDVK